MNTATGAGGTPDGWAPTVPPGVEWKQQVNCPFCDEEIQDRALVCKHCGRDLTVLRPVLDRFSELEARLSSLEAIVHTLGVHVEKARTVQAATTPLPAVKRKVIGVPSPLVPPLTAIALLIAAHWLIVGIFDLNTWILRLVSILIPLPFGWTHPRSTLRAVLTAVAIAGLSITGMLLVTSHIDQVPVLPQNARDWTEIAEYAASIGLSYMTGCLLGWWMAARRSSTETQETLIYELASLLARQSAQRGETRANLKQRIEAITHYLNILAVLMTAGCSIVTGIGRFLP